MHYVLKNDKANHLGAAPLQYGKVRRGFLGIEARDRPIRRHLARTLQLPRAQGIEIMAVREGSPAAAGGLLKGDILLQIAGEPVGGVDELHRRLQDLPIGEPAGLVILRTGELKELTVTPIEAESR